MIGYCTTLLLVYNFIMLNNSNNNRNKNINMIKSQYFDCQCNINTVTHVITTKHIKEQSNKVNRPTNAVLYQFTVRGIQQTNRDNI